MAKRKVIVKPNASAVVCRVCRALIFSAVCNSSIVSAQTADPSGTGSAAPWLNFDLPADRSSLLVSLSVRQKELGDMHFETGDLEAARNAYNDALATLKAIKIADGNNLRDLLDLIEHDADYRKRLLDARLPFWGARVSAEPQLPLLKAEEFKNRVQQIRALADEISLLLDKLRSSEINVVEKSIVLDQDESLLDTKLVQLEQLDVKNAYFSASAAKAVEDIDKVRAGIEETQGRLAEVIGKLNAVDKKIQKAAVGAISQAIGMPEEVAILASDKPLKQKLLNAGLALTETPEFSESLARANDSVRSAVDTIQEAKRIRDEFVKDRDKVIHFGDDIRTRSLKDFALIGASLIAKNPEFNKIVASAEIALKESAPIVSIVALAKENELFKKPLVAALREKYSISVETEEFQELEPLIQEWLGSKLPAGKATRESVAQKRREIYSAIVANVPAASRKEFEDKLVSISVGMQFVGGYSPEKTLNQAVERRPQAQAGKPDESEFALKAVMSGGLAFACPQGALAKAAFELTDSIAESARLADQIKEIVAEIREQTKEVVLLQSIIREARYNEKMAEYEGQITRLKLGSVRLQIAKTEAAQSLHMDSLVDSRTRIRRRMARFQVLCELAKRELSALESGYAQWLGGTASDTRMLSEDILGNPQWLRFIIDPEIDFQKWVRTPESEELRWDIDAAAESWVKKAQAIEAEMAQLKFDGDDVVAFTQWISVSELFSYSERAKFKEWLNKTPGTRGDFSGSFILYPPQISEPALPKLFPSSHRAVRLITVQCALDAVSKGSVDCGNLVELLHPGYAFFDGVGGVAHEYFEPKIMGAFDGPISWLSGTESYAGRWIRAGDHYARRALEGYSPYTTWHVSISDPPRGTELKDVKLRFIYQYRRFGMPKTEQDYLGVLIRLKGGLTVPLSQAMFELVGDPNQIKSSQEYLKGAKTGDVDFVVLSAPQVEYVAPLEERPSYIQRWLQPETPEK